MKVWALVDKYEGDIKAILNETGKHNVEKQLMELGRKEVKEQIDNLEDFGEPQYNGRQIMWWDKNSLTPFESSSLPKSEPIKSTANLNIIITSLKNHFIF